MKRAVFAGEIKTVLVWKLDRISRKMLDGLTIMRMCLNHGVGIVSITQQIDMSGPMGLLFAIAEFQLNTMKENQAAGIALAKKRGVYKGRKKGTTKLYPEEIYGLRETLTIEQIAKLKDVKPRTVYNTLARKRLTEKEPVG